MASDHSCCFSFFDVDAGLYRKSVTLQKLTPYSVDTLAISSQKSKKYRTQFLYFLKLFSNIKYLESIANSLRGQFMRPIILFYLKSTTNKTNKGGHMDSVRNLISNRWFWFAAAVLLAFLIYHAPRIAHSIPFI